MDVMACKICGQPTGWMRLPARGAKTVDLHVCEPCNFWFHSNQELEDILAADGLDCARLNSAGLLTPTLADDFKNGSRQAKVYIDALFTPADIGAEILDVGCSSGYFMEAARRFGASPHGLELNKVKAAYVREGLKLPCYESMEELLAAGARFSRIFMFFSLEYISAPIPFLEQLLGLLNPGGELYVLTPNLEDGLLSVWRNSDFKEFFLNECSICYYSARAANALASRLRNHSGFSVRTTQGYSFLNHFLWHKFRKPTNTGMVGMDEFPAEWMASLATDMDASSELARLIAVFERDYKWLLERHGLGNRIEIKLKGR